MLVLFLGMFLFVVLELTFVLWYLSVAAVCRRHSDTNNNEAQSCIMLSFYQAACHLIIARSQSVLLSNWSKVKKGQTDMFIYL